MSSFTAPRPTKRERREHARAARVAAERAEAARSARRRRIGVLAAVPSSATGTPASVAHSDACTVAQPCTIPHAGVLPA